MSSTRLAAVLAVCVLTATVSADRPVPGAGGSVKVVNYCRDPVRLNSVGDSAGETFIIPHREHWREQYKMKDAGGGPSIKISQEGTSILQLEYTIAGPRIFYDLSYVNCWNQKAKSGESCPFWHQSFVLESPSHNIPCTTGQECPYPYRCPRDDNPSLAIINGPPVSTLEDDNQGLTLHLCPCEHDRSSDACKLARQPGRPLIGDHSQRMLLRDTCPEYGDDVAPAVPLASSASGPSNEHYVSEPTPEVPFGTPEDWIQDDVSDPPAPVHHGVTVPNFYPPGPLDGPLTTLQILYAQPTSSLYGENLYGSGTSH